jgi:hypothetical protein
LQGTIFSALLISTVVAWDDIVIVPWGSIWPKQFAWYGLVVVTSCDQQSSWMYLPYLPWGTYMPYGILTVLAIGNVHAIFGVLTVLDLGISVPLILALRGTVAVASCEQQHEFLIVAWESV